MVVRQHTADYFSGKFFHAERKLLRIVTAERSQAECNWFGQAIATEYRTYDRFANSETACRHHAIMIGCE